MGGCLSGATCDTSDQANSVKRYTGGIKTGGVYESSPWHSGWLHYPGGSHYELVHNLGATPAAVFIYLAFEENPSGYVSGGCVGNTCEVLPTDTSVQLKNDTCSEYWVRVVAMLADGQQADGGSPAPLVEGQTTSDAAETPSTTVEVLEGDAG